VMWLPLAALAFLAVVAAWLGWPTSEPFAHFTQPVFEAGTRVLEETGHLPAEEHFSITPFLIAWAIAAVGTFFGWMMYAGAWSRVPEKLAQTFPATYRFAVDKFRVDELYGALVLEPVKLLAYYLWRIVDVFTIDGLLVNGIARLVGFVGSVVRVAQNGDVQRYAAIMAVAAAIILYSVGVGGR
jgi:NADH-quinone oxidoreductase subunit L